MLHFLQANVKPNTLLSHLLIVIDIDHSLCPLPSWNFSLEQDINLPVGPILHLRQEEVCHNIADQTRGSPNIATSTSEISAL